MSGMSIEDIKRIQNKRDINDNDMNSEQNNYQNQQQLQQLQQLQLQQQSQSQQQIQQPFIQQPFIQHQIMQQPVMQQPITQQYQQMEMLANDISNNLKDQKYSDDDILKDLTDDTCDNVLENTHYNSMIINSTIILVIFIILSLPSVRLAIGKVVPQINPLPDGNTAFSGIFVYGVILIILVSLVQYVLKKYI